MVSSGSSLENLSFEDLELGGAGTVDAATGCVKGINLLAKKNKLVVKKKKFV